MIVSLDLISIWPRGYNPLRVSFLRGQHSGDCTLCVTEREQPAGWLNSIYIHGLRLAGITHKTRYHTRDSTPANNALQKQYINTPLVRMENERNVRRILS